MGRFVRRGKFWSHSDEKAGIRQARGSEGGKGDVLCTGNSLRSPEDILILKTTLEGRHSSVHFPDSKTKAQIQ